jgi:serine/threonine protein kinase
MEGRTFGGTYRILRRLGEGGMGVVFEAEHLRLHRRVAVKVLSSTGASNADLLARFQQEAEIIGRLEHPHVVTVLDYDVTERGEPYLVLELLHGETLQERLSRQAPLDLTEAVRIATQIASALTAAECASIVHRDLKPSNVFLTDAPGEGTFVKLLDFGISKNLKSRLHLTEMRVLIGTPEYMAPEQAMGNNQLVDARTDQYALAVVLYEMLTGEQPFAHDDIAEVLRRVLTLDAPRASTVAPWIPEELDTVLARALEKSPAARFGSVAEFTQQLATAARTEAPPPSAPSAPPFSGPRITPSIPTGHPPAPSVGIGECLDRARAALTDGAFADAVTHAECALHLADENPVPAASSLIRLSEPLLARVFVSRLGSVAHRLCTVETASPRDLPLSPHAAFLLSRIDEGMSVAEVLDVASVPRLEALRNLVHLVSCGAVRLE